MTRLVAAFLGVCLLLSGCGSCRTGEDPDPLAGAADAATALFALASSADDDPAGLAAVVREDLAAAHRVSLLESLDALGGIEDVRVISVEPLGSPDTVTLDLEGTLQGDAVATFTAQTVRLADGTWRVTWFSGPGLEWPRGRGTGNGSLTTSTPPGR